MDSVKVEGYHLDATVRPGVSRPCDHAKEVLFFKSIGGRIFVIDEPGAFLSIF